MVLVVAILLAAAPEANLSLLRPASGSDGLLGVEGARPPTDPHEVLQLQIGFDAQYKPVRLGPGARIESRLAGWAQLWARLNDLVSIFAQLPVMLRQTGDLSALGAPDPAFGFGVGGDQRMGGEALLSAARRRGDWELIGNAFVRFRPPRDVGTVRLGNEIGVRGGAAWWRSTRSRVYAELELQTSLRDFAQQSFPIEWRLGSTLCATSAIALDVAAGTRLDDGLGAPSLRGVLALRYTPSLCSPPKRDTGTEPGLKEMVARIAKERAEREKAEQEKRIPGLLEPSETAAREALIRSEAADLLPASEGEAASRATIYGEEQSRDSDGDGVPDAIDNCPHQKGPADNAGCPRAEKQIVALRETRLDILDKVYFAPGKAAIQPRSMRLLNQIARVLKSHPEVVRIEVQGHTDSSGGTAMNMTLSQARAEAVVGALIRRGVSADRMVARGFGPTQPIATNTTRQGRERNRRVEFRVAQRRTAGEVIDIAP